MRQNKVTDLEQQKRLVKRFKRTRLESFYDDEVLELFVSLAFPKKNAALLAGRLLERFKGFREIFEATQEELESVWGVGEKEAVFIRFMREMVGVYLKRRLERKSVVRYPRDVLDFLNLTLSEERNEKFLAIYLNAKNEVLGVEILYEGTIDQMHVYPRKAIEHALKYNARSVIFAHNHPSGDPTPSRADLELSMVLEMAALAVDMNVHDHIIIGKHTHFSGRENGWLLGGINKLSNIIQPLHRLLSESHKKL
jgi:DNA repair protein RadC